MIQSVCLQHIKWSVPAWLWSWPSFCRTKMNQTTCGTIKIPRRKVCEYSKCWFPSEYVYYLCVGGTLRIYKEKSSWVMADKRLSCFLIRPGGGDRPLEGGFCSTTKKKDQWCDALIIKLWTRSRCCTVLTIRAALHHNILSSTLHSREEHSLI